jgi:hypothetical protein
LKFIFFFVGRLLTRGLEIAISVTDGRKGLEERTDMLGKHNRLAHINCSIGNYGFFTGVLFSEANCLLSKQTEPVL